MQVVQWDRIKSVHWLLAEYLFSPEDPSFTQGSAYRLVIRNTGEKRHVIVADDFFRAIAVKTLQISAFAGHTGEDHVDESLGPVGLKGVPVIPVIPDSELMSGEADLTATANPFAAEPEEDDQASDGDEESETAPIESAEDVAPDDDVSREPTEVAEIPTDDEPTTEPLAETSDDPKEADETSAEMVEMVDVIDWAILPVTEIAVEPGHETIIEFVAVRAGRYDLYNGNVLSTIRGMFTTASIIDPQAETKTAAVSE